MICYCTKFVGTTTYLNFRFNILTSEVISRQCLLAAGVLWMWNIILEYMTAHFNILGKTWPGNLLPTFHTHQRTLNLMMMLWWLFSQRLGRKCTVLNPGPVVCESITFHLPIAAFYLFKCYGFHLIISNQDIPHTKQILLPLAHTIARFIHLCIYALRCWLHN